MRIFVLLFFISIGCFSQSITGKVVGIMDGDTFKLLTADSTVIRICLANIDCPEKKQAYSAKTTEFTSKAIFGKTVTINVQSKDRYRRYIANVIYDENLSLGHELVKHGWAWHYVKYSKDKSLQDMEDNARKSKIGLWQDPNAIAPWEWRESRKKKNTVVK